jgi:hypothetical protein
VSKLPRRIFLPMLASIYLFSGCGDGTDTLTSPPATPMPTPHKPLTGPQYNSGNSAWNHVTPANWPVFACGIGKMTQLDFEDCVNSY